MKSVLGGLKLKMHDHTGVLLAFLFFSTSQTAIEASAADGDGSAVVAEGVVALLAAGGGGEVCHLHPPAYILEYYLG